MSPIQKFFFVFGGFILLGLIIGLIYAIKNRYRCPQCGSREPRTISLVCEHAAAGGGYFGDEYESTCPACGNSYTYMTNMWLYGN